MIIIRTSNGNGSINDTGHHFEKLISLHKWHERRPLDLWDVTGVVSTDSNKNIIIFDMKFP